MITELDLIMGLKKSNTLFRTFLLSGLFVSMFSSCIESELTTEISEDDHALRGAWCLSPTSYVISEYTKTSHEAYVKSNIDSTIISVLDGIVEFHEDSTFSSSKTSGTYVSLDRKLTLHCNYGGKTITFEKGADVGELLNPPPYRNDNKALDEQSDNIPPSYIINSLAFRIIEGQLFLNLIATLEEDKSQEEIGSYRKMLQEDGFSDEIVEEMTNSFRRTFRTIESHNIYDRYHY